VGNGLETGRRIFYLKVEEGKSKEGALKNLFGFFDFAVHKILPAVAYANRPCLAKGTE
jgi:hypothetical protein